METEVQLLYKFEHAAKLAQISSSTLRGLARSGKLETVRIGRSVRVPRHELMRVCGINQTDAFNTETSLTEFVGPNLQSGVQIKGASL